MHSKNIEHSGIIRTINIINWFQLIVIFIILSKFLRIIFTLRVETLFDSARFADKGAPLLEVVL